MLNEYRLTRPRMYQSRGCPGFADKSARQGYYVVAETAVDAVKMLREQMGWHFETLDVQLWVENTVRPKGC